MTPHPDLLKGLQAFAGKNARSELLTGMMTIKMSESPCKLRTSRYVSFDTHTLCLKLCRINHGLQGFPRFFTANRELEESLP